MTCYSMIEAVKAVDEATLMYKKATAYFCEDVDTDQTTFFSVFIRFGNDFKQALKEVKAMNRRASHVSKPQKLVRCLC